LNLARVLGRHCSPPDGSGNRYGAAQASVIARILYGAGCASVPFSVLKKGDGAHPISGLPEIGHV
jgi:hypothetical protein